MHEKDLLKQFLFSIVCQAVQNERDRIVSHKRSLTTTTIDCPSLSVNSLYDAEIRTRSVRIDITIAQLFLLIRVDDIYRLFETSRSELN